MRNDLYEIIWPESFGKLVHHEVIWLESFKLTILRALQKTQEGMYVSQYIYY